MKRCTGRNPDAFENAPAPSVRNERIPNTDEQPQDEKPQSGSMSSLGRIPRIGGAPGFQALSGGNAGAVARRWWG